MLNRALFDMSHWRGGIIKEYAAGIKSVFAFNSQGANEHQDQYRR